MSDWSHSERVNFMETIDNRIENGKSIAEDKRQARLLCEIIQDLFLSQFMSESTRGNRILDLMFSNVH